MPILSAAEKRKLTREKFRILRPYILRNRRKEHALEAALLHQVKEEEARKKRDAEAKRQQAEERRKEKLAELEEELKSVREKRDALNQKLKSLQEGKHEQFVKLKNALMAKEIERQEKHMKDVGDMHLRYPDFCHPESQITQFPNQQYGLEHQARFMREIVNDSQGKMNPEQMYHQHIVPDSNWKWPSLLSQSQQQLQQGVAVRPTSSNSTSHEQYNPNKGQTQHYQMPFKYN